VLRIDDGKRQLPDLEQAGIRGTVTAFTSTQSFSVNGQPVDASAAAFPDGTAFGLGSQVEARGTLSAGTLHADRVRLAGGGSGGDGEFDLFGAVANLQSATQTFAVQGQVISFTVDYSQATFEQGTVADLHEGAQVEVRADIVQGSATLVARRIRFR
jgi:hypothetical protein